MARGLKLTVCLAVPLLLGAAAPTPTPKQAWQAGIDGENKDYAQIPHAMLKIQDSAYIGEGQQAVLRGEMGKPASWHWVGSQGVVMHGAAENFPKEDAATVSPLAIAVKGGKIVMMRDGKQVDAGALGKSIAIDKDIDIAGFPTQVGAGVPGWRVFIYNQQNPAAKTFTGVAYYPFDPAFRVTASFKPDPQLPARTFRTSRGTGKQFHHAGDATFILKGRHVTLPFYSDGAEPKSVTDMSAFFHDDLTGKGAYGAGRYVDVQPFGTFPPASVVIDFNQAYNPNCARSAHFTCPLAVDTIPLAVAAGEKDPHLH
jgi:hypothetical protein